MTQRPTSSPIVDLSVPIVNGMTIFPGDPAVEIAPALTIERDRVDVLSVHIGSQTGTHVDAPCHILAEGLRLDQLPLDRFIGPAVVADVRHVGAEAPIRWGDLASVHGSLRPGAVLLLHTGWAGYFDDPARYRAHPWLEPDAAARIIGTGVRTVGLDALNIDATPEELDRIRFDAHEAILGVGGVIVENLTGLEGLTALRVPVVSVLPLKLSRADGAPVRAVAFEADAFRADVRLSPSAPSSPVGG